MPPEHNETPSSSRWAGLQTRTVSAAIAAAVFIGALLAGGWLFTLLVIEAALVMRKEWNELTQNEGTAWHAAGLAYAGIPCASLIWLRYHPSGVQLVLFVMFAVWATDIGAYFAGRRIGGPKLAPVISPNKTWAGLGGGMLAAAIVGGFSAAFTPYPHSVIGAAGLAALLAAVAQGGDLFESWLKRRAGVKDSGTLLPGHGGLLDRIDGLVAAVPLYALAVALAGAV